jgi:hypothetical protein
MRLSVRLGETGCTSKIATQEDASTSLAILCEHICLGAGALGARETDL